MALLVREGEEWLECSGILVMEPIWWSWHWERRGGGGYGLRGMWSVEIFRRLFFFLV